MHADYSGRAPIIKVCLTPGSLAAIEAFFLRSGLRMSQRFVLERLAAHRRLTTLERTAGLFNHLGMDVRVFQGTLEDMLSQPPGSLVCSGTGELLYTDNPFTLPGEGEPHRLTTSRRWYTAWIADHLPQLPAMQHLPDFTGAALPMAAPPALTQAAIDASRAAHHAARRAATGRDAHATRNAA